MRGKKMGWALSLGFHLINPYSFGVEPPDCWLLSHLLSSHEE